MNATWKIKDLIDLEYFLDRKFNNSIEEKDDGDLDRKAYLSFDTGDTVGKSIDDPSRRKHLVRHWLEMRREQEKENGNAAVLPGAAFSETIGIIWFILIIVALVLGSGLTWSLLSYQGRQPINVFTWLWVLVVPQVLLLVILALSAALLKMRAIKSFKLIYPFFTSIIGGMLQKISHFAAKRTDAEKTNRIREIYALLGKTETVYGAVFFWPVFLMAQVFGIFFNAGILGALFFKVAITDLAFGWQTTLQAAPQSVFRLVEMISWPWSWLLSPPVAHPTLEQIAGSQMILKEGIFHLATGDLAAWWPFMFLAVLFYGLLPRLILAGTGVFLKYRSLSALDFSHSACDRLVMRMKTPRVNTRSMPYQSGAASIKKEKSVDHDPTSSTAVATSAIVLVPTDIANHLNGLDVMLKDSLGIAPAAVIAVEMDSAADSVLLRQALQDKKNDSLPLRVVVIQEAWQPPIRETITWIRSLRAAAGGTPGMVIALIGKPGQDSFMTAPSDIDRKIWEQAVNTLKDPYLRTESLGGNNR